MGNKNVVLKKETLIHTDEWIEERKDCTCDHDCRSNARNDGCKSKCHLCVCDAFIIHSYSCDNMNCRADFHLCSCKHYENEKQMKENNYNKNCRAQTHMCSCTLTSFSKYCRNNKHRHDICKNQNFV